MAKLEGVLILLENINNNFYIGQPRVSKYRRNVL